MTTDRFYQHRPRTMIPVTVQPNDGQRFIRFRSSDRPADDFGNRMSLRMREFEDECRRWREEAFRNSSMDLNGFPHSSMLSSRPRLFMDFPDFPEFGSVDWPSFRGPALGSGLSHNAGMHRSFVEEDNDGRKRYKVQFDIGDFRPEELNVRVEGRMLIVKGDRQVKVGHATESKQFNRELTIPEFVDAKNIQSYLTDDGQLILEAPVLLDRVYNNQAGSTPISSSTSNRVVDTTFSGGRPTSSSLGFNHNNHVSTGFTHSNPVSTGFSYNPVSTDFGNNQLSTGFGNNQSSAYSSTSSTSSFRQESTGLRDAGSFSRNSPLRDQYSSAASSTSTLIGGSGIGGPNNQISSGFSTNVARPEQYSFDRANGSKTASYTFDLHQFAPEDIAIQVNDTMLKVTAVKQERDARNSSQREYRREIGLPDGADPKNLTNSLGADGVLTIQIPVRDHRPPLTPTLRSQQFNLPTNVSTGGGLAEGEQQLKLTFDLSGYKPDDVTVKVNDNVLKVQAAHAENTPGNQISREYMREYVLPDWVNADKLRAKMSEDSTLTVEVPIPHDRVSSLNRQINITH